MLTLIFKCLAVALICYLLSGFTKAAKQCKEDFERFKNLN